MEGILRERVLVCTEGRRREEGREGGKVMSFDDPESSTKLKTISKVLPEWFGVEPPISLKRFSMVGQFESLDFICSKPGFPALKDGDFRSISIIYL